MMPESIRLLEQLCQFLLLSLREVQDLIENQLNFRRAAFNRMAQQPEMKRHLRLWRGREIRRYLLHRHGHDVEYLPLSLFNVRCSFTLVRVYLAGFRVVDNSPRTFRCPLL